MWKEPNWVIDETLSITSSYILIHSSDISREQYEEWLGEYVPYSMSNGELAYKHVHGDYYLHKAPNTKWTVCVKQRFKCIL